jgi:hypothetical protein
MKRNRRVWLMLIAVMLVVWAAVPAAAHNRDEVTVRNGVVATAGYVWADADWTDVGFMWFEVGEIPTAKKGGKKTSAGSAGVLVSVTAIGPQECYLDLETPIGVIRVMHGSLVIDGSNGTAVFDGDRLVEIGAVIPVHVHEEEWTVNSDASEPVPPEFLCAFDEEVGSELWLEHFTFVSGTYDEYRQVPLDARWENVEVASGGGKGKGRNKPQTELLYQATFAIDLDADGTPETPGDALDVWAELGSFRGGMIPYYRE